MSFGAKKPRSRKKSSDMAKALEDVAQEPTTRLNVEVTESSMKLLKKIVAEKGVTIREYVNGVLETQMRKDASKLNVN